MSKTIAIDEDGYFLLPGGIRYSDTDSGREMLKNLYLDDFGVTKVDYNGETIIVEPFDKPYVAQQIHNEFGEWKIQLPYSLLLPIQIESFCLDEWDRFHGQTLNNIPFVLTRKAQAELLQSASGFSDTSITLDNNEIETESYYLEVEGVDQEPFWTNKYTENSDPLLELVKTPPRAAKYFTPVKAQ